MTAPQTLHRAEDPYDWAALLRLIRAEFAYMDARISPPSSALRLTEAGLGAQSHTAEIWVIGSPPIACTIVTPKPGSLYIGKLAVAAGLRGKGHARALIARAEASARLSGLPFLELETRIELTENHTTFRALGFEEVSRSAHEGFAQATSITFRRPL